MDRQLHLQTARSMPPCGSGRRARAGQCRGSSALPAPTSSGMPRPRPAGAPVSSPTCATTLAAGEGVCAGHQPPLGRARSGVPRLGTKRPGVWPWDGAAGHGGRAAACCQHGGAARLCEPGQSGGDPLWRAQSVPVQVVDRIRSAPKICTVLIKSGIGSRGGRNVRAPCDPESGCPRTWPSGPPRVPSGTGQRPRAGQRWPHAPRARAVQAGAPGRPSIPPTDSETGERPAPLHGAGFRLHRPGCGAGRLHTRGVPGSCRGEYQAGRQPGRTGRGAAVVMKAASSPGRLSGHGRLLHQASAEQHCLVPEGNHHPVLPLLAPHPTTASAVGACWLRCCIDSIWIIRCGGPVRCVAALRVAVARRRACWRPAGRWGR
jgi:hypothetical protein